MRHLFTILILTLALTGCRTANPAPVSEAALSSLLIGHVDDRSIRVQIEGSAPGTVVIQLREAETGTPISSRAVELRPEEGLTGHAEFRGLTPSTEYLIVGPGPHGTVTTRPEKESAGNLRIVFGSAIDPMLTDFGGIPNHRIWEAIAEEKMDALFLLGDNINPARELYQENHTGASAPSVFHRHYHALRGINKLPEIVRRTPVYATWDDWDYGVIRGGADSPYREAALSAFHSWFANPKREETVTRGTFFRADFGPVEFFFLDSRSHRSPTPDPLDLLDNGTSYIPRTPGKQMLGPEQLRWLREGLQDSTAHFKIVLNGHPLLADYHPFEHWGWFREREEFLTWLKQNPVSGLVFLTGGHLVGELSRIEIGQLPPLYEMASSGLGVPVRWDPADPRLVNPNRVGSSVIDSQHYGVLEYREDQEDGPSLVLELRDENGETSLRHEVPLGLENGETEGE